MENIEQKQEGMSYDTKTIIVILTLILVYPVGLVLMFVWMKWPWWVKALVGFSLLIVPIALVGIILVAVLAAINPSGQVAKAKEMTMKNNALELVNATERYYAKTGDYPWGSRLGYRSGNIKNEVWLNKLISEGELKPTFGQNMTVDDVIIVDQVGSGVEACFESPVTKTEMCIPE